MLHSSTGEWHCECELRCCWESSLAQQWLLYRLFSSIGFVIIGFLRIYLLWEKKCFISVTFVNMNTTMKLKSMRWLMPSYYCYADAGDLDVSIESAWISLNVISICWQQLETFKLYIESTDKFNPQWEIESQTLLDRVRYLFGKFRT